MSNTFLDLAKERYSVRKFTEQQIEQEKLDKILEAGNVAPTAVNYQPQRIYVLQSEEALAKVSSIRGKQRLQENPFCLLHRRAAPDLT